MRLTIAGYNLYIKELLHHELTYNDSHCEGSKRNREMLCEEKIKAALVPLGRKSKISKKTEQWVKQKQRKRNTIEGKIGISKVHYGLERLLFKNEELNIRMGLLSMNLSTALARM